MTKNEMTKVEYEVNGNAITLDVNAVQQFVTKGNGNISETEAVNFLQLCKHQGLNPFLNEAYLIKFGNQPAQQVVGKEAYMKRAGRNENFDGYEAGIVVFRNNEIIKKAGQAVYPNEELFGGWAKVYRKDITRPYEVEVSLQEFSKGQSTWKQQPANMIRKVALVNALREAFPEDLGGLHTEEEPNYGEDGVVDLDVNANEKQKPTSDDVLSGFKKENNKNDDEENKEKETIDAEFEEVDVEDEEKNEDDSTNSGQLNKDFSDVNFAEFTVDRLKSALDYFGVEYDSHARKPELVDLAETAAKGGESSEQSELF